jgi:phosphatidylinositol dimannoside acyltransferase
VLRTHDTGVEHIGTSAYKAAATITRYLPAAVADAVASTLGVGSAQLMRQRRAVVVRNLTRIDPTLRGARLERAVRNTFESYALYWVESFRLPYLSRKEVAAGFRAPHYHRITDALELGNGCILALPHLGGWEWAGRWMVDQGHALTVVVEPVDPPELFEFMVGLRRSLGMNVIGLGTGAGSAVVKALQANHVVCLVTDRDILGGGIDVEFFGEKTTMPAGPATMSFRTGAPILPVGVYYTRQRNRRVADVRIAVPAERKAPKLRDDIARVTQDLTWELEGLIRRAPDQWHMMQPNWPADADLAG